MNNKESFSKCFDMEDQLFFAHFSGDFNPIHVDSIAARRLVYGEPVVHGLHSILWALDCWSKTKKSKIILLSLRAMFPYPLLLNKSAHLSLRSLTANRSRLEIVQDKILTTIIEIKWKKKKHKIDTDLISTLPEKHISKELSIEEIKNAKGFLDLYLDSKISYKNFSNLTNCLCHMQIAILLATTRLVGRECPGAHSIFSELKLNYDENNNGTNFQYYVKKIDHRFNLVAINLIAPKIKGSINAFIRSKPVGQMRYSLIKKQVSDSEFNDHQALIVGGSRGLGEVCAKLLAAGGASVIITYNHGKEESENLANEIVKNGGKAFAIHLNILLTQKILEEKIEDIKATDLYYFATPFIFSGQKNTYNKELYNNFYEYYVEGFTKLVDLMISRKLNRVFYPSTVAINDKPPGMSEYTAAKYEGELACKMLQKKYSNLIIHSPRLERMNTDQTQSILSVTNLEPVPLMLDYLRKLRNDI
jgi:acyl dehydratase/NADP-dependent 3-hydroxy acid dehydrogenase YdfG